jgi:hypothetical protein
MMRKSSFQKKALLLCIVVLAGFLGTPLRAQAPSAISFGCAINAQEQIRESQALVGSKAILAWMKERGFKIEYMEVNADHGGMIPLVLPSIFDFFDRCRSK